MEFMQRRENTFFLNPTKMLEQNESHLTGLLAFLRYNKESTGKTRNRIKMTFFIYIYIYISNRFI